MIDYGAQRYLSNTNFWPIDIYSDIVYNPDCRQNSCVFRQMDLDTASGAISALVWFPTPDYTNKYKNLLRRTKAR
jgi:hypothetical protein